jgi:polyisoprenoid-binding protein YceI
MKSILRVSVSYRYAAYLLIGSAIFLTAFSVMPVSRAVLLKGSRANGVADADIKVLGTSNLHNWSMEDKDVSCTATFTYATAKSTIPTGLKTLTLSFPVHSLKSGKSGMDSKAYSALKAKDGGNIAFSSTSSTIIPGAAGKFAVKSNGSLTIAGVTQPVVMDAACQVMADGTVSCTGTEKLKMSDYLIKPPTYMMGALKTGDALTIEFTLVVKK